MRRWRRHWRLWSAWRVEVKRLKEEQAEADVKEKEKLEVKAKVPQKKRFRMAPRRH